jgi:hypothetical protein
MLDEKISLGQYGLKARIKGLLQIGIMESNRLGRLICFIDNDCIPDSNLINTYIKPLKIIQNFSFEGRICRSKKRHFRGPK